MGGGGGGAGLQLLQAPGLLQGGVVQALSRINPPQKSSSSLGGITISRSSFSTIVLAKACCCCSRPILRCRHPAGGKRDWERQRRRTGKGRGGGEYHVVSCCSESGIAETTFSEQPPLVPLEHSSNGGDASSPPPVPFNVSGELCYTEAGIEVVRSLEEAENEVLKAVSSESENQQQQSWDDGVVAEKQDEEDALASWSMELDGDKKGFEDVVPEQPWPPSQDELEAQMAEEQTLGEQFHLLRTLEQPTSAVAAAVMVAQVAEALKEADTDEEEMRRPLTDDDGEEGAAKNEASSSYSSSQLVHVRVQEIVPPDKSVLEQMWDIIVFAGPALGIWLSGPIMSLIDTSVIGQSSSLELAALGPGTVLCDNLCYVFMFLSVATSNLIATSLAQKDEDEAAGHLSRLLFVAVTCGVAMLIFTQFGVDGLLRGFVGAENANMIPAARTYVQIRALAWPAVLVGLVSQSASLGMQDSVGPLKSLAIASAVNLAGDIFLCTVMGYGIAGAAWATMASQYVAAFLMMNSLYVRGYNVLAISSPSWKEFVHMVNLAAPILLTMISKVTFYTLITYLATTLGAVALAAHQVMVGICYLCSVWGEPLAQTAQSFMPAFIHGSDRNLKQARSLLGVLMLMGVIVGFAVGCLAISVPWLFPYIFTKDPAIIAKMRSVTLPLLCSLVITPPTHALEGTLLAGRDMKFLGLSMTSCFCGGSILLLTCHKLGWGLQGSWWTLAAFQWARFAFSYARLSSSQSILRDPVDSYESEPILTPA
ncbi:unnamed protein product [Sphagnum troendelagicum]